MESISSSYIDKLMKLLKEHCNVCPEFAKEFSKID